MKNVSNNLSKVSLLLTLLLFASGLAVSQSKTDEKEMITLDSAALVQAFIKMKLDSITQTLKYETGEVKLANGIATINVPAKYKYLNPENAKKVLVDLWGNPEATAEGSLGMIFPEQVTPMDSNAWGFNITYDAIGFVEDDDSEDLDYEELLTQMKEETSQGSVEREKLGYESIRLVGWATKPYYDASQKVLYWAKEIEFGGNPSHTLNYNVRVLGRKGVLILNAIGSMEQLNEIDPNIKQIYEVVKFTDGNKYSDFNPDLDEVAAYGIGGLIAGKVLAKVGLFAVLAKFGKVIIIGLLAGLGFLWKLITGRNKKDNNAS